MAPNLTNVEYDDYKFHGEFRSYTELIIYNAIAVVGLMGILGDMVSLIVWTRPSLKSSSSVSLAALAVSDLFIVSICNSKIYLLTILHYSSTLSYRRHIILPYFYNWAYPVYRTAQTSSTYLTLAIALERYDVVCRPFKSLQICTHSRARKFTLAIIIASCLYNLPLFLYMNAAARKNSNGEIKYYAVEPTETFSSPMFQTIIALYGCWLRLVVIYLLPLTCISVLNARIYLEMKKTEKLRMTLSTTQREEIKTTRMLVYVVFEFIVCSSVEVLYSIMEILNVSDEQLGFDWTELIALNCFFIIFNSSSNVFTYFMCGSKFRKTLFTTFSCCLRFCRLELSTRTKERELSLRIQTDSTILPTDGDQEDDA